MGVFLLVVVVVVVVGVPLPASAPLPCPSPFPAPPAVSSVAVLAPVALPYALPTASSLAAVPSGSHRASRPLWALRLRPTAIPSASAICWAGVSLLHSSSARGMVRGWAAPRRAGSGEPCAFLSSVECCGGTGPSRVFSGWLAGSAGWSCCRCLRRSGLPAGLLAGWLARLGGPLLLFASG